jgi:hypothetical protein
MVEQGSRMLAEPARLATLTGTDPLEKPSPEPLERRVARCGRRFEYGFGRLPVVAPAGGGKDSERL